MDRAGAGVHGDEISRQDDGGARQERMLRADAFDLFARKCLPRFVARFEKRRRTELRHELFRERTSLRNAVTPKFLHHVGFLGMDGDGEIRRQGPGRRRPDDDARFIFQRAADNRNFT